MTECWRKVPGYEGLYEVSDHGRVRSLGRVVMRSNGNPLSVRERVLKAGIVSVGYPVVVLCGVGSPKTVMVHRLVAEAFLGKPGPKREVDHKNGNRADNRASNLRWVTRSQNNLNRFPYQGSLS